MRTSAPSLGQPVIALLAQPSVLGALRGLASGAHRASLALVAARPGKPAPIAPAVLGSLKALGALRVEPGERAGGERLALTELGWDMVAVADRAAECERVPEGQVRSTEEGARVLAALADAGAMSLVRRLALAPADAHKLWCEGRTPGARTPALARRVNRLVREGFTTSVDGGVGPRFQLTRHGHMLAAVELLAMWAERDRLQYAGAETQADIVGAVRLLAPVAAVPDDTTGLFVLHQSSNGMRSSVCLQAAHGRLAPTVVHGPGVAGFAIASAPVWLDGLFRGRANGIMAGGDKTGLATVFQALSVAIRPIRTPGTYARAGDGTGYASLGGNSAA